MQASKRASERADTIIGIWTAASEMKRKEITRDVVDAKRNAGIRDRLEKKTSSNEMIVAVERSRVISILPSVRRRE